MPETVETAIQGHRPVRGAALTIGYGVTTVIWALGYLSLFQPGLWIGNLLFAGMIISITGGGVLIGRATGQGWLAGAAVGMVSALLNLLIVGSLIAGSGDDASAAWWVPMLLVGSIGLGALGAIAGKRLWIPREHPRDWYAILATLACVAVFLLLISGGIVTGTETGLAVPDWPTSFGHNMFLFPLTEMTSESGRSAGVHYEHAHRLYGTLVGLTAIILLIVAWTIDRRAWFRWLVTILFIAVCVQGYLGGARVLEQSLTFGIIHGVFAQCVFATFCAVAAFRSRSWFTISRLELNRARTFDHTLSLTVVILVLIQLSVGAAYRHFSAAESTVSEPALSGLLHGHWSFGLLIVAPAAIFLGVRAWGIERNVRALNRTGLAICVLIVIQIILGFIALVMVLARERTEPIPASEIVMTTAHQATGALILVASVLAAIWVRRAIHKSDEELGRRII